MRCVFCTDEETNGLLIEYRRLVVDVVVIVKCIVVDVDAFDDVYTLHS